jgi:hypothetical protein
MALNESPCCWKGEALLVLSLMRAASINMFNGLKHPHIRNERMRKWPWEEWIEWLKERIVLDFRLLGKGHRAPD